MTVILSWIIAALGIVCLCLLGSRSYQKHLRQLAEEALERSEEQRKKVSRTAGELGIRVIQQQREISALMMGHEAESEVSET